MGIGFPFTRYSTTISNLVFASGLLTLLSLPQTYTNCPSIFEVGGETDCTLYIPVV